MKRVPMLVLFALGLAVLSGCGDFSKKDGEKFEHFSKVRSALGHVYETGTPGFVHGDSTLAAVELLRTDKYRHNKEARGILDARLAAWRVANPMMRAGYVKEVREHT